MSEKEQFKVGDRVRIKEGEGMPYAIKPLSEEDPTIFIITEMRMSEESVVFAVTRPLRSHGGFKLDQLEKVSDTQERDEGLKHSILYKMNEKWKEICTLELSKTLATRPAIEAELVMKLREFHVLMMSLPDPYAPQRP